MIKSRYYFKSIISQVFYLRRIFKLKSLCVKLISSNLYWQSFFESQFFPSLRLIFLSIFTKELNFLLRWQIPKQGGMLIALFKFHRHETSELVVGLTKHIAHTLCCKLLPTPWHANIWWHRVYTHKQDEAAMSVVVSSNFPSHFWVLLLIFSRRHLITSNFSSSMFYVD